MSGKDKLNGGPRRDASDESDSTDSEDDGLSPLQEQPRGRARVYFPPSNSNDPNANSGNNNPSAPAGGNDRALRKAASWSYYSQMTASRHASYNNSDVMYLMRRQQRMGGMMGYAGAGDEPPPPMENLNDQSALIRAERARQKAERARQEAERNRNMSSRSVSADHGLVGQPESIQQLAEAVERLGPVLERNLRDFRGEVPVSGSEDQAGSSGIQPHSLAALVSGNLASNVASSSSDDVEMEDVEQPPRAEGTERAPRRRRRSSKSLNKSDKKIKDKEKRN